MTQSFGPPQLTPSSSVAAKNVYNHVWKGLVFLASDPYTKVNQPAQFVVHSLHDKVSQSVMVITAAGALLIPWAELKHFHNKQIRRLLKVYGNFFYNFSVASEVAGS
jgi:hypothetical protein